MVSIFHSPKSPYYLVQSVKKLVKSDLEKLTWLFSGADVCDDDHIPGFFVGPRREMVTPWSTNAVEITQNMGIEGIQRIEAFEKVQNEEAPYDPMLQQLYNGLDEKVFEVPAVAEPVREVEDVSTYNVDEGLALSDDEVEYLEKISQKIGRKLTDSEVYGFAQINSEHCRHKIFNGTFIIDGREMKDSLFALIKKTSKKHPDNLVSAYKDNVAFIVGPQIEQFAPTTQDKPDFFEIKDISSVLSLKAETHNFPTTVEPFNGASTGSGGEIRDRLAGGKASWPLAGTAVYMTSYTRRDEAKEWENRIEPRKWLYQEPEEILIKASDGASDFGNKFGQPLINGSLLTFEHEEADKTYGYDKVIMLAGGIGFAKKEDAQKGLPEEGDLIIVLGGDNYRIGMGGGAVSSVATGEFGNSIELNAVQRANPEMQKRVANAIRAMAEADVNPIISIHDHGAGGHLNSLSELVEDTGAVIKVDKLPVGDPTLSAKEILGNESQERMGLVIKKKDVEQLDRVAKRERAPIYEVGEVKSDKYLKFVTDTEECPIDLELEYFYGKPPKTVLTDTTQEPDFAKVGYEENKFELYLANVLRLEAVACKDWLTNKVDRSVTGKVATQQCVGAVQLPLNNLGVMALDYQGLKGIATALGHAPVSGLVDPGAGSRLAVAESLTNLLWAPLSYGLKGVSLSANWMWPARNKGENARLYQAVKALSDFAMELGINIPTGKDSLSMTQKYPDGQTVYAPGTVIISAVSEVKDIRKTVTPNIKPKQGSKIIYIDFAKSGFELGGSSFAQTLNRLGTAVPDVADARYFAHAFETLQQLVSKGKILAGHDISAGGLATTLLEMNFPNYEMGMTLNLDVFEEKDLIKVMFSEKPGVVIQVADDEAELLLKKSSLSYHVLGAVAHNFIIKLKKNKKEYVLDIDRLRDVWYETSYMLDRNQSGEGNAHCRFRNYKRQELSFYFSPDFNGNLSTYGLEMSRRRKSGVKAAIIREKGVNGDREMAFALHLAGFDVKDVHMTDLIKGREDLSGVNMIVFVGGFSNSDVLGSAKGWAGAFLYNHKAKKALDDFYARNDTLSLGVCNGCQLMAELGLIYPKHPEKLKMLHNDSGKFESNFINVDIQDTNSVMLKTLSGSRLGVWVAHGEGKFSFPYYKDKYNIAMKYSYDVYPGNPNGSDWSTAAVCSNDGRHLAMMPHLERSFFPWQWPEYGERRNDEVTPWIEAFVNARKWVEGKIVRSEV